MLIKPITDNVISATKSRLEKNTFIDTSSGCIIYVGDVSESGYGRIAVKQTRYYTHRIIAVMHKIIAADSELVVDHLCSNKLCLNPDHLEAVTQSENQKRAYARGERQHKTHCINGHEFTLTNTYVPPNEKRRSCKICSKISADKYRASRKASNQQRKQQQGRRTTMSDIQWDEFGASEFVKFANKGDSVSGKITNIRVGQDFNGNPCPVLDIDTNNGSRTVTAGQANLKSQIVQLRPSVGDTITITYDRDEKAEKGMKKVFAIKVDSNTAPF